MNKEYCVQSRLKTSTTQQQLIKFLVKHNVSFTTGDFFFRLTQRFPISFKDVNRNLWRGGGGGGRTTTKAVFICYDFYQRISSAFQAVLSGVEGRGGGGGGWGGGA